MVTSLEYKHVRNNDLLENRAVTALQQGQDCLFTKLDLLHIRNRVPKAIVGMIMNAANYRHKETTSLHSAPTSLVHWLKNDRSASLISSPFRAEQKLKFS